MARNKVLTGVIPPISSSQKVTIRERGKERIITPIRIADRVIQRVLCDNALVPLAERRLIYDNVASRKDMGISFARNRFNLMLERAKRKWGNDFYALTFDFKSFFDSVPHWVCKEELEKVFEDRRITNITMQVIESYQKRDARIAQDAEKIQMLDMHKGRGLCLGSQVSQIMALVVPNTFDHYVKDVLGVKEAIRYMDDGVILHKDRAFLEDVMEKLRTAAEKIGLKLHPGKTRITHIRHGIRFLKIRYRLDGMKTVRRLCRDSIVRMRRKLVKLERYVTNGTLTAEDVYSSLQSWLSHAMSSQSFHARRNMIQLYESIYADYPGYRRLYA